MPTYDYQCRACGNTIEVIHPMSEDGPTTCEVCGGSLRRVIYPAGIIFKGSGFYKTDSRGSSSSSAASGRNGGAPSADAADGASKTADKGTPAPASADGNVTTSPAKSEPARGSSGPSGSSGSSGSSNSRDSKTG